MQVFQDPSFIWLSCMPNFATIIGLRDCHLFSHLSIIIQLSWLHEYRMIPVFSVLFYSFVYLVFGSCRYQEA